VEMVGGIVIDSALPLTDIFKQDKLVFV